MYNCMSFNTWMQNCSLTPNYPLKLPLHSEILNSPATLGSHWSVLHHCNFVCWQWDVNRIMKHAAFWDWILAFSIMYLRSIQAAVWIKGLFLSTAKYCSFVWMHQFIIHSSVEGLWRISHDTTKPAVLIVDEHLGYFWSLVIYNRTLRSML